MYNYKNRKICYKTKLEKNFEIETDFNENELENVNILKGFKDAYSFATERGLKKKYINDQMENN